MKRKLFTAIVVSLVVSLLHAPFFFCRNYSSEIQPACVFADSIIHWEPETEMTDAIYGQSYSWEPSVLVDSGDLEVVYEVSTTSALPTSFAIDSSNARITSPKVKAAMGSYNITIIATIIDPNVEDGGEPIVPDEQDDLSVEIIFTLKVLRGNRSHSVSLSDWTYEAAAQQPVLHPATVEENGTVSFQYSETKDFVQVISTPKNAGAYWVRAVIGQTANYNSLTTEPVSFSIARKPLNRPTLMQSSFMYNNGIKSVQLNTTDSGWVFGGIKSWTNAGSFTATVALLSSNYKWSAGDPDEVINLHWEIKPASLQVSMQTEYTETYGVTIENILNRLTAAQVRYSSNAGVVGVPGGGAWGVLTTNPNLNAGDRTLSVRFTPANTTNFAVYDTTISISINRATPVYTVSQSSFVYGTAVVSPRINQVIEEGATVHFEYAVAGTGTYTKTLPIDADSYWIRAEIEQTLNYNSVKTPVVAFTISKANRTVSIAIDNWVYHASPSVPRVTPAITDATVSWWYYKDSENGPWSATPPVTPGTHWLNADIGPSKNFNALSTPKISFTIHKASRENSVAVAGWTFGSSPSTPVVIGTPLDGAKVVFEYSTSSNGVFSSITPTLAGTYYVRANIADTANSYGQITAPVSFVIAKAERKCSVSISGWTYNSTPSTPLIQNLDEYAQCIFEYSQSGTNGWTTIIPTTVGLWYVRAAIGDSTNYLAQTTASTGFEIVKAVRSHSVQMDGWMFNELPNTPKVSGTVSESASVLFEYSDAHKTVWQAMPPANAGLWFVRAVIAATQSYNALTTAPTQFIISKAARSHTVTLSKTSWTYNSTGAVLGIAPTVSDNSNVMYRFSSSGLEGSFTIMSLPETAGTWFVRAVIAETDNYLSFTTTAAEFTIVKANRNHTIAATGWEFGQNPVNPTINENIAENPQITFFYASAPGGSFTPNAPHNVGTWYVYAVIAESTNYSAFTTLPTSFQIMKASRSHSVSIQGWNYTPLPSPNPAIVSGTVEEGASCVFQFSAAISFAAYTTAVPVDAGTWYVRAIISETTNFNAQTTAAVQFTISPAMPPVVPSRIVSTVVVGSQLRDVALDAYPGWSWANPSEPLRGGIHTYLANYRHLTEPDNYVRLDGITVTIEIDASLDILAGELAEAIASMSVTDITLNHDSTIHAAIDMLQALMAEFGFSEYTELTAQYPQLDIAKLLLIQRIFDAKSFQHWRLDNTWRQFLFQESELDIAFSSLLEEIYADALSQIDGEAIQSGGIEDLESSLSVLADSAISHGEIVYSKWQEMSIASLSDFVYSPTQTFTTAAARLPQHIQWGSNVNESAIMTAGTHMPTAQYQYQDFNKIEFRVIIYVHKATRNNIISLDGWTYGSPKTPTVGAVAENGTVTFYYSKSGDAGTFTIAQRPTEAGTYWVQAVIQATSNFYEKTTDPMPFTITKANRNHTVSLDGWKFDAIPNVPTISGKVEESANVVFEYFQNGSGFLTTPPISVGLWNVRAVVTATLNYNSQITEAVQFEISKADQSLVLEIEGWSFGQQANSPRIIGNILAGTSVEFFYSASGKDGSFTLVNPPSESGTYFVRAYVGGTDNYNPQMTSAVQFTISMLNRNHTLSIDGWMFGQTPNSPKLNNTPEESPSVKFYYSSTGVGTFPFSEPPAYAGMFWVRAEIAQTKNYKEQTTSAVLYIVERATPHTAVEISGTQTVSFLSDITLPEGWSWVNPSEALRLGTDVYYMNYKHPTQPTNYVQRTNVPIAITSEPLAEEIINLINLIDVNAIHLDSVFIYDVYSAYQEFIADDSTNALLITNRETLLLAKRILDLKRLQKVRMDEAWVGYAMSSNLYTVFRGLVEDIYMQSVIALSESQINGKNEEDFSKSLIDSVSDAITKGENTFKTWQAMTGLELSRVYEPNFCAQNLSLPLGVEWGSEAIKQTHLTAGMHTLIAKYSVSNFEPISFSVIISVAKATSQISTPIIDGVFDADMLATVTLPACWAWEDPQQLMVAGKYSYWAVYSPVDANYTTERRQIMIEVEYASSNISALIATVDCDNVSIADAEQILLIYEKIQRYKETLGITSDEDPELLNEIPNVLMFFNAKALLDAKLIQQEILIEAFSYLQIPPESKYGELHASIDAYYLIAQSQINLLQNITEINEAVQKSALAGYELFLTWESLSKTNFSRAYTQGFTGQHIVLPKNVSLIELSFNTVKVNKTEVLNAGSYVLLANWSYGSFAPVEISITFVVAKANINISDAGGMPIISGVHSGVLADLASRLPARWRFENPQEEIKLGRNTYWIIFYPEESKANNYNPIRIQIEIEGGSQPNNTAKILLIIAAIVVVFSLLAILIIRQIAKARNNADIPNVSTLSERLSNQQLEVVNDSND